MYIQHKLQTCAGAMISSTVYFDTLTQDAFLKHIEDWYWLYASGDRFSACLPHVQCHNIAWINAVLLSIGYLGRNFSEFCFKTQHTKMKHSRKCVWQCRLQNINHLFQPEWIKLIISRFSLPWNKAVVAFQRIIDMLLSSLRNKISKLIAVIFF